MGNKQLEPIILSISVDNGGELLSTGVVYFGKVKMDVNIDVADIDRIDVNVKGRDGYEHSSRDFQQLAALGSPGRYDSFEFLCLQFSLPLPFSQYVKGSHLFSFSFVIPHGSPHSMVLPVTSLRWPPPRGRSLRFQQFTRYFLQARVRTKTDKTVDCNPLDVKVIGHQFPLVAAPARVTPTVYELASRPFRCFCYSVPSIPGAVVLGMYIPSHFTVGLPCTVSFILENYSAVTIDAVGFSIIEEFHREGADKSTILLKQRFDARTLALAGISLEADSGSLPQTFGSGDHFLPFILLVGNPSLLSLLFLLSLSFSYGFLLSFPVMFAMQRVFLEVRHIVIICQN
jgi:hypothetical protein